MAEREKLDPMVRLRIALEDNDPEVNPDHFCELIAAVLANPGDPIVLLCKAVYGHYRQGQLPFFEDWASGLAAPAPRMRRQVVKAVREDFEKRRKG